MDQKSPLITLMFATRLEATPFINGFDMSILRKKPFSVFQKDRLLLIISGVGKVNAAMATVFSIIQFKPDMICNLGAAGALDTHTHLGDIYLITKVFEYDRPDFESGEPYLIYPNRLEGFQEAILATQDQVVVSSQNREEVARMAKLADMEGAAIIQACRRLNTMGYLFKFVSDVPGHMKKEEIIGNMKKYASSLFSFFVESILPTLQKVGK